MLELQQDHWCTRDAFVPPPRRKDLIIEIFDDEVVLYDTETRRTHQMNRNAFDIWLHCDGERSTLALAARQVALSDTDSETALDHTEQLVALFAESGLLSVTGQG